MKKINCEQISMEVAKLCIEANCLLGVDMQKAFNVAIEKERTDLGVEVLKDLKENFEIAKERMMPICQDTGTAVVFIELGQQVEIVGGSFEESIQVGVRKGYQSGYLRKSIVQSPFLRKNTGDNTPAIIHTKIVDGDTLKITVMPKGGGSENVSRLVMLNPAQGREGVAFFVLETLKLAGPNACPPYVVGVAVGGNFEAVAVASKEVLTRDLADKGNSDEAIALEQELLIKINELGIGAQGFGGDNTAFSVKVNIMPCHIASLPVAVNISCHVNRHKSIVIQGVS